MTSFTFFLIFVPLLAVILLAVNLIFAPHNPYQEKDSAFECGFHSFLGQNRTQFSISFFIFALLFLLFDLEILLVYPYVVSAYDNGIYGLVIVMIFFLALTLGFAFELGKNALKIDSKQMKSLISSLRSMQSVVVGRFYYHLICHTDRIILSLVVGTNVVRAVQTGELPTDQENINPEQLASAADNSIQEQTASSPESGMNIKVVTIITETSSQAVPGEELGVKTTI
ncbi:MAG: NADH-quinone oxidoreductase subunit A [Rickettsiales bacterium]|nr:MAG: NADH-quinone oxidoreductase subunit A [Rickettsiales bacterium]